MTQDSTNDIDRRSFIRRAAATGAISLGAVGSTAGTSAARAAPASRDRAEALLDAHAGDVLSMLEADGVLADQRDLPTAVANDLAGIAGGTEGAALLSMPGRAEELRVVKQVEAGTLTITVQPDDRRAFAVLDTGDGRVGYDLERGRYDFSTASCRCTGTPCGPYPSVGYLEECCVGSDCDYQCACL